MVSIDQTRPLQGRSLRSFAQCLQAPAEQRSHALHIFIAADYTRTDEQSIVVAALRLHKSTAYIRTASDPLPLRWVECQRMELLRKTLLPSSSSSMGLLFVPSKLAAQPNCRSVTIA